MKDISLGNDSIITRRDTLVAAQVGDQAMLMDMDSGAMFQLNRTGARIWELVETPRTLADLITALERSFPGGGASLRDDVTAFVRQMHATGLLEVSA